MLNTFCVPFHNLLLTPKLWTLSSQFFPRDFIVFTTTFGLWIISVNVGVLGEVKGLNNGFLFFHENTPFQHCLLRRTAFPHLITLSFFFQKSIDRMWVYLWTLFWLTLYIFMQYHSLYCYSFIVASKLDNFVS